MTTADPDCTSPDSCATASWCSLSFRFDANELRYLRGAEQVWGAYLAARLQPEDLPTAIALAKAGRKVAQSGPGLMLQMPENELRALLSAVRYSADYWDGAPESDGPAAEVQRFFTGSAGESGTTRPGLCALAERLSGALRGQQR